jgi:hypothetical protein
MHWIYAKKTIGGLVHETHGAVASRYAKMLIVRIFQMWT